MKLMKLKFQGPLILQELQKLFYSLLFKKFGSSVQERVFRKY